METLGDGAAVFCFFFFFFLTFFGFVAARADVAGGPLAVLAVDRETAGVALATFFVSRVFFLAFAGWGSLGFEDDLDVVRGGRVGTLGDGAGEG